MGCYGNHEISYNQRAFIFEDNIGLHISGPNELIYTHNEMSNAFNLGLITPCILKFTHGFLYFLTLINIHEYANKIISYRTTG